MRALLGLKAGKPTEQDLSRHLTEAMMGQVEDLRAALLLSLGAPQPADPKGAAEAQTVVIAIIYRMAECCKSLLLLATQGNHRDCATLASTLLEIRTDLQYMARNHAEIKAWLKHESRSKKPWSVRNKLDRIYKEDKEEASRQYEFYSQLCLVKHGNPVAGNAAFLFAPKPGGTIQWRPDDAIQHVDVYLFATGMELLYAARASRSLLAKVGVDIDDRVQKMDMVEPVLVVLFQESIMRHRAKYPGIDFKSALLDRGPS